MERALWHPEKHEYFFRVAIGKSGRVEELGPKTGRRTSALPDSVVAKVERAPRHDGRWLLCSKTGGVLYHSLWSADWHAVRTRFTNQLPADHWLHERIARADAARAAEPDPRKRMRIPNGQLDLYELKHHALTWMVTPAPHGLGLDPRDASWQACSHQRSADVIERWYVKQRHADTRARVLAAMGQNVVDLGAVRGRQA